WCHRHADHGRGVCILRSFHNGLYLSAGHGAGLCQYAVADDAPVCAAGTGNVAVGTSAWHHRHLAVLPSGGGDYLSRSSSFDAPLSEQAAVPTPRGGLNFHTLSI